MPPFFIGDKIMSLNKDGFEAGKPVSLEDILRAERKSRRAAIEAAAEPAPAPAPAEPKTTRKTRKSTDKLSTESGEGSPSKS